MSRSNHHNRNEEAVPLARLDGGNIADEDISDDDGLLLDDPLGSSAAATGAKASSSSYYYYHRNRRNRWGLGLALLRAIPLSFLAALRWALRRVGGGQHQYQHQYQQQGHHTTTTTSFIFSSRIFRLVRFGILCALTFVGLSILNGVLRPSYQHPPEHYQVLKDKIASSSDSGRGNPHGEKIFIAANIVNEDLIRGAWGDAVLGLIDLIGETNVFVSIYENDSGKGTSEALREFHAKLRCKSSTLKIFTAQHCFFGLFATVLELNDWSGNSSVVTGAHLPLSDFSTVHIPDGTDRVLRITYLAEVRNRLLRPLATSFMNEREPGFTSVANVKFDKVLFINDVYFDPVDAVQLLFSTNAVDGKAAYRAACAIDFVKAIFFYDSFVVRDREGYQLGLVYFPWFSTAGSGAARAQVKQELDTIEVRSCWGGMAAFDAALFQTKRSDLPPETELELVPSPLTGSSAWPQVPLTFRGSGEAFWEAAECCLIFADAEALFGYPEIDQGTGVFINPYIRVAYSEIQWNWIPFWRRYERMFEFLQYIVSTIGYPEFNPRRLHEPGQLAEERVWTSNSLNGGIDGFENVQREVMPGGFCGQRRMFAMKPNLEESNRVGKNWEKVGIPPGL